MSNASHRPNDPPSARQPRSSSSVATRGNTTGVQPRPSYSSAGQAWTSIEPVDLLLVDDRTEDLLTLAHVLAGPEYRLQMARTGPEALKRLLEQDFAVILLDVLMPVMDGFELASLIKQRERSQGTPIIFLTAGDGADLSQIYRGYSLGAVDYLSKPLDPDVLRAKVRIFADLFRKDRRLERQAEALREGERREREVLLTELRHAAERRYLHLAEAVPLCTWTADPRGNLTYTNRFWNDYTRLPLSELHGTSWLAAVHAPDREGCASAWREAIAQGQPLERECRLVRGTDGVPRWHLSRTVPELSETGQLIGWIGTHTDIEEAKRAIIARDEFLSIASHELRTPLTALKLRLQSVLHARDLPEKAQHRLDNAVHQTERLERLIENLLDVSRITTGHLELELESFDLSEMAQEVTERFREQAARGGTVVELDAPAPVVGKWDRLRLEQVATNLLSNALKFGERRPIRVVVQDKAGQATLTVSDQGIGIAPENVARIFHQFERVVGHRTFGGLGMGLYIARQIVQAHGGSVEVDSCAGKGSHFHVILPRQGANAPAVAR
ncbi:MAG TPA: ATP-binding protein [Polyangiaceae bacterium]|nr:ATP-binding protein [Polyangiaceae bacterium]